MNNILKIISIAILVYGLFSVMIYLNSNTTGYLIAQVKGEEIPGISFYRSGVAIDIPACSDKCYPDTTACYFNQERICTDINNDGCAEWSEPYDCPNNEKCGISACGDFTKVIPLAKELHRLGETAYRSVQLGCINECNPGDITDSGKNRFYKVCGTEFDRDPCYEWSPDYECPESTRSRAGRCVKYVAEKGKGFGKY